MAIEKRTAIEKIEIVFSEDDQGNRFPKIHARGKIELYEDGRKLADIKQFRYNPKNPDQDAGDQPDPSLNGEKIPLSVAAKNQLRAVQNALVDQATKDAFTALKAKKEL